MSQIQRAFRLLDRPHRHEVGSRRKWDAGDGRGTGRRQLCGRGTGRRQLCQLAYGNIAKYHASHSYIVVNSPGEPAVRRKGARKRIMGIIRKIAEEYRFPKGRLPPAVAGRKRDL
jgi:hypothetical protein